MGSVYTKQIIRYILIFFAVTFTSASMESGYYFLIPFLEGIGSEVGTLGGLVMGVCYGVSFLLRPLVPFAARFIGNEKVIRAGFFCFFISACGIALFARTPEGVIVCRAIAGIGMGVVTIILQSYEYQLLPADVRGRCARSTSPPSTSASCRRTTTTPARRPRSPAKRCARCCSHTAGNARTQIHKRRRENGSPPLSLFYNDFLLRENANFCDFSE